MPGDTVPSARPDGGRRLKQCLWPGRACRPSARRGPRPRQVFSKLDVDSGGRFQGYHAESFWITFSLLHGENMDIGREKGCIEGFFRDETQKTFMIFYTSYAGGRKICSGDSG